MTDFINDDKYKIYFYDNSITWINNLEKIKLYIDENNKRPNSNDKNKEIKSLGIWMVSNQLKYKIKKEIMKIDEIYNKWTNFINDDKYKKYF